jgi:hypothetical protein
MVSDIATKTKQQNLVSHTLGTSFEHTIHAQHQK